MTLLSVLIVIFVLLPTAAQQPTRRAAEALSANIIAANKIAGELSKGYEDFLPSFAQNSE